MEPPLAETVAPPRNFTLSLEARLRAYAQGAPSYIRRRRRIEDLERGAPWRPLPSVSAADLLARAADRR
jgi:hypothetical protein